MDAGYRNTKEGLAMAVLLTVSETVTGAEVSDTLAGGATGLDFGQVSNGLYTPFTNQAANTGHQDVFIRHDATVDPITSVKLYVAQYSGTYGGADSAANDITTLLGLGAANTGADKNNVDGNSRGLHVDMDWQVSTANQFDPTREATGQKRIFGKDYSGLDGSSLALGFTLNADAASYWNGSSEVDATTPVAGSIGKSSDTVLGNRGHVKMRFYLNNGAVDGGILQWDTVIAYSYTA
jgi:hypothetical protein